MNYDLFPNISAKEYKKELYVSLPKENKNGVFSPCNMTPDDVDYEMSKGKDKHILQIIGMNQKSFEYFVQNYGETYEELYFFKSQLISDFSPLAKLKRLKGVYVYWNTGADSLWNMSENTSLTHLVFSDCKKIIRNLTMLKTGMSLISF